VEFRPRLPRDGINVSHNHPLREALLLAVAVLGIAIGLTLLGAFAVDLMVPQVPPTTEVRLFGPFVERLAGSTDLGQADLQASLASLVGRLSAHWDDSPYAFRIWIWTDPTPNAFALPGGVIAVTSGLLEDVASENELAFILAHEVGHFYHRHHLRNLGRGFVLSWILGVMGADGNALSGSGLGGLASALTMRGFNRDQEREADRFGLELVFWEYGHVAGSWDFFAKLPEPSSELERSVSSYTSTHPVSTARIQALKVLARERSWPLAGEIRPFSR
jgi:predicted Zn-dependent protease